VIVRFHGRCASRAAGPAACRRPSIAAALACFCALGACSTAPPRFDPYGRPYEEKNLLEPHALSGCDRDVADTPPMLNSGTRPLFPAGRLANGYEGDVVVQFDVTADGRIVPEKIAPDAPINTMWFKSHAIVAMHD
jgi:hypothetical protein